MGDLPPSHSFEEILRQGILAARTGSHALAQRLLEQASRMQPYDARPWVELAEIARTTEEKIDYLERALIADPFNARARHELAVLKGKLSPQAETAGQADAPPSVEVDATQQQAYLCPHCGSDVVFDPQHNLLQCAACGQQTAIERQQAAGFAEQVLDFVLPTARGHRWARAQNRFRCGQCGALSLWPPGQRALECPYCGTHQLIASEETRALVDPLSIGLLKVDRSQAQRILRGWLQEGWNAPDDLRSAAVLSLRLAYYPFWLFDGALRLPWRCEVNDGSDQAPRWVARTGEEYQMFDDVLIPGYKALDTPLLRQIQPFETKEIVAFKPEYLAGWPALTYDRPLAEAALQARGRVVARLWQDLHRRVLPGREKRNLTTGATAWSGLTFNHVLLPVWVGEYRYRRKVYRFLINGQTGAIAGQKPVDRIKVGALMVSAVLTLVVLTLIALLLLGGR